MAIFDNPLAMLQLLFHLGTLLIVASFKDDDATWRPGVSILASAIAGSSLGMAFMIVFPAWSGCAEPEPWSVLQAGLVFFLIATTRGNVAKLLPRRKWSNHP
jgi:hypothetical protein